MIYKIVVLALLVCEFRWRLWWLRLLLAAMTAYYLISATTVGPAMRRSLTRQHPVNFPVLPTAPPRVATEFERGILIMVEEAKRDLEAVLFPTFVLTWLAASPVLSMFLARTRGARKDSSDATPSPDVT